MRLFFAAVIWCIADDCKELTRKGKVRIFFSLHIAWLLINDFFSLSQLPGMCWSKNIYRERRVYSKSLSKSRVVGV